MNTRILPLLAAFLIVGTALWPISASAAGPTGTTIIIDGHRGGPVFDGIGAISGGGGNSRLLIDYPPAQRTQILNYLFGPGGADLQLLKLEIGGDTAEPSIEHSPGQVDCDSGYEWWLAEQAVARNPRLKLYGLQWAAPGWIGSIWSQADISYVLNWLNCAKSHGLTISYLGGWNENGYNATWFEDLRQALNQAGYDSVRLIADDAHPSKDPYDPASAWAVASAAASDPAFKSAIAVIGVHDTCGVPTTGYTCEVTAAARKLGLPLWESEIGAMNANSGAVDMARSINAGYIQAGITGYLEWPLLDSIAPGLEFENRGLVTADQPWSGNYVVDRQTWAIAQTTQFAKPGWRHALGANGTIGASATYNSYLSPDRRDWSLVAENTGRTAKQRPRPQRITVRLAGGLSGARVQVWSTDLTSANPARWFARRPEIRPDHGTFSYTIPPGYVVSFTSTAGQSHYRTNPPAAAGQAAAYRARPDASAEAWDLSSQEGAFIYQPCLGGIKASCIEQLAGQEPLWWHPLAQGLPTPYAVIGDGTWGSYKVSSDVLFTDGTGTASLIGRFAAQADDPALFNGYQCNLQASGAWQLVRDSSAGPPTVLRSGAVGAITPDTWHALALSLTGRQLSCKVNGLVVGTARDGHYQLGLAGIGTNWDRVQFSGLRVS
jgi:hypothetical protein